METYKDKNIDLGDKVISHQESVEQDIKYKELLDLELDPQISKYVDLKVRKPTGIISRCELQQEGLICMKEDFEDFDDR